MTNMWWLYLWAVYTALATFASWVIVRSMTSAGLTPFPLTLEGVLVCSLMNKHGLRHASLMMSLDEGAAPNAYATKRQVTVTPRLVERLKTDELLAVVAHEIGHLKMHHMWKRASFTALVDFGGFAAMGAFVNHLSWPVIAGALWMVVLTGLLYVAAIVLWVTLGSTLTAWFARQTEFAADLWCLEVAGVKPRVLVDALWVIQPSGCSQFTDLWLPHPTLRARVQRINDWDLVNSEIQSTGL